VIRYIPFAGTCTAWRQILLGNQTWWQAWCDHRWCASELNFVYLHAITRSASAAQLEHTLIGTHYVAIAGTELLACGSNNTSPEHSVLNDDWQQYALTRGLHIPWRYKPVNPKRLLYCVGRQVSTLWLQLTTHTCTQLVLW